MRTQFDEAFVATLVCEIAFCISAAQFSFNVVIML